ncbi:hypothetical protein E2C01_052433 [Portunus trituberculatus]|uniref:Secreted protein n=1 Tax=Portunus trituberculatus TaxID=210409 RepID=A0A5B7GMZ4_PORTR|nr:hypothetical protein [Portunus trituberculatus]
MPRVVSTCHVRPCLCLLTALLSFHRICACLPNARGICCMEGWRRSGLLCAGEGVGRDRHCTHHPNPTAS